MKIDYSTLSSLLPKTVSLTYVDRDDSLDESFKEIQTCIHENSFESLDIVVGDNFLDQKNDSIKEIMKDLRELVMKKYTLSKKDAKEIIKPYKEDLEDIIFSRDDSDLLKELFDNTSKFIMHYDTGYEMKSESWSWSKEEIEDEVETLKTKLQITSDKYNNQLWQMICQATYGGQLVVFFRINVYKLINGLEVEPDQLISFTNPEVAIINTCNGSGDNTHLYGHTIRLDFNRKNLFIEKTINYNYTYAVCGMSEDWCDCTQVLIEEGVSREKIENSKTNDHIEQQAAYDETFKSGSCTYGDKLMRRHRSINYYNNFPCGNTCDDCQTFWVD